MEEFQTYRNLLQRLHDRLSDRILDQTDLATYMKMVGGVRALEEAYLIPDVVLTKLEELREHRTKLDESAELAARERQSTHYGTRLWGAMASPKHSAGVDAGQVTR